MKTLMIAAAAVGAIAVSSTAGADANFNAGRTVGSVTFDNVCAYERENGWVVTGIPSTMRDWDINTVIGESVGDGNCVDGWSVVSAVDPRIDGVSSRDVRDNTATALVGTDVTVTTANAGRITAEYQGFAPWILKGTQSGANDKWKLVSIDNNGGGTYKVTRPGNTTRSRGDTLLFTAQMLKDRDNNGNCTTAPEWCRNLRYAASRDTTVTTNNMRTTQTRTFTSKREVCPSVWSYEFVSPAGEVVAANQEDAKPCTVKTTTRTEVINVRDWSTSSSVTGDKYVTPQN